MINTSNEYKQYIRNNREFVIGGTITLTSSKVITLTNQNVRLGGFELSEGVSSNGTFSIGSTIISQCTITLDNSNGQFDEDDFVCAIMLPTIGLKLSASTEILPKGRFTVDSTDVVGNTIVLYGLDNLYKLDRPFSELLVVYPITLGSLMTSICSYCEVPYNSLPFTNDSFQINAFENSDITFREVVSYIAQIASSYVKCDTNGYLTFDWYDMSVFEQQASLDGGVFDSSSPYATGDNVDGGDFTFGTTTDYDGGTFLQQNNFFHIYSMKSSNFEADDVVITGIRVCAKLDDYETEEVYLFGTEGYVLEVSENPLIQVGTAQSVATSIGGKLVGMKFRPCEVSCISDPSIESGDIGYISDTKGNSYNVIITNLIYTIGSFEKIICDAESPSRNSSKRFSAKTKAIVEARNNSTVQLSKYDLAVQTMTEIITNGLGLYQSVVDTESGRIFYQHDKPTMAESLKRWFMTDQGYIQQTRPTTADEWATTSGVDVYGNALYNTITVRGLNADWITTGALTMQTQNYTEPKITINAPTTRVEPTELYPIGRTIYDNTTVGGRKFESLTNTIYDDNSTNIRKTSMIPSAINVYEKYQDDTVEQSSINISGIIENRPDGFTANYTNDGMTVGGSNQQIYGMKCGSGSFVGQSSSGWTQYYVNYSFAYPNDTTANPKVFLTGISGFSTENIRVTTSTKSGFIIEVFGCLGFTVQFNWLSVLA